MPRPHTRVLLGIALVIVCLLVVRPEATRAAAGIALPAPPGSEWQILAGYNTVTHSAADKGDPYAIDLERVDAPTSGSQVLAPFAGTVSYTSASCLSIRDSGGTVALLCHVFPFAGIRGRTVGRGQPVATVAPPGEANNNGTAHIHMALTTGGTNIPFTGAYALEGRDFPATTAPNAYSGERVSSSNVAVSSVDAGADQRVRAGVRVTLTATPSEPGALIGWSQLAGPAVQLAVSGATATFTAPSTLGTLQFQAEAFDSAQRLTRDTVTVDVTSTATAASTATVTASGATSSTSAARLVSGGIPGSGFGLVVFSGGTTDALLAATGCPRATAAFWTTDAGRFVVYIPATTVAAVNAGWRALYPAAIPANTAILGKCR